ncbi:MAG: bifunctional 4-hydroxy-2-oxoglutarate aldolase/2-dehydro-3-deoxy-phosphogluconate aldolase [Cyclobacteriaceae bacterium]
MREAIVNTLLEEKLVVVIRSAQQSEVGLIIDALAESGVKAMEVTSNTPGYTDEIAKARAKYPDLIIGAGTIRSAALAEEAIAAGAQFLVSPNINPDLTQVAHPLDVPVLMGALTPTDVSNAIEAKADVIKIFPADIFGIEYLKAIQGPFDQAIFFAVGGIGIDNAKAWIEAGAKGIGVGGKLTKLQGTSAELIKENAKKLVAILKDN